MLQPKYLLELLSYKNQNRRLNVERMIPFLREVDIFDACLLTAEEREDVLNGSIKEALEGMLKEDEEHFIITPDKEVLVDIKLKRSTTMKDSIIQMAEDILKTPEQEGERSVKETLDLCEQFFHQVALNHDRGYTSICVTGLDDSDNVQSILALTAYTNQVFYVGDIIKYT